MKGRAPCGVRKLGCLDAFPPMAEVSAVTTVFPDTGLLRFLLTPKNQIMNSSKLYFPLKVPDCCLKKNMLFSPCLRTLPQWWVMFRVVTGELIYCARAVPKRPQWGLTGGGVPRQRFLDCLLKAWWRWRYRQSFA